MKLPSCRESEIDDVAILNDVLFALQSNFAVFATRRHGSAFDQPIEGHDLGADETARDVAVDLASRELCHRAPRNGPRAALVLADGEERNVTQQIVAGANDAVEPRLVETEICEESRRVGGFELRNLELDLGADGGGGGSGPREKWRETGDRATLV